MRGEHRVRLIRLSFADGARWYGRVYRAYRLRSCLNRIQEQAPAIAERMAAGAIVCLEQLACTTAAPATALYYRYLYYDRRPGLLNIQRNFAERADAPEVYCSQCAAWKPRSAFRKTKRKRNGLSSLCRDCHQRKYYHAQPLRRRPCWRCGKEFPAKAKSPRKYCSAECRRLGGALTRTVQCGECGASFETALPRKYCSHACATVVQRRAERTSKAKKRGPRPPVRQCLQCGSEFAPKSRRNVYCSQDCYQIVNRQRSAERNRRRYAARPERACPTCGTEFAPFGRRAYCSEECRRLALPKAPCALGREKPCLRCGTSFLARTNQRWCSSGCREQALAERKPPAPTYTCAECQAEFKARRKRECCSPACTKRHVARRRALEYQRRREQFAGRLWLRQLGRCGLVGSVKGCGCQLDKYDFHIDHVVPRSRGGLDTPDNLQLLCPDCNRNASWLMESELAERGWQYGLANPPARGKAGLYTQRATERTQRA